VLTILDSWQYAVGANPNDPAMVINLFNRFKEWGTLLLIDHERAPTAGDPSAEKRPFGSTYKYNSSRSVIRGRGAGEGVILNVVKHNFCGPVEPLYMKATFNGLDGPIKFERVKPEDEAFARDRGADGKATTADKLYDRLCDYPQGISVSQLSVVLAMHEKTVANNLSKLRKAGRAEVVDGMWRAVVEGDAQRDENVPPERLH
jgi:hypothetical protein